LKHPVRLTALAEADIAQAFRWYEAKKPYLGEEFIERVEEAIEKIAQEVLWRSHHQVANGPRY
jgi:plasmid stabilization system protein ParE